MSNSEQPSADPSSESGTVGPAGINVANVSAWFDQNVPQIMTPLQFEQLPGGHSNLTYRVTGSNGKAAVLRRGPLGHVLPTAHDMGREFRAISALGPTPVPVPAALGFCDDEAVTGAKFYVMGHVDGIVMHDFAATTAFSAELLSAASDSMFDVLGELHAVDIASVGMDAHGKRDGYVERQLKRWYQQFTAMKDRDVPTVDAAYNKLIASIPSQQRAAIVHGDYRLGNTITDTTTGKVAAVLDWEISTLGDPMADLGYLVTTWVRKEGQVGNGDESTPPTMADGFREVEPLVARYAAASGLDISDLPWYTAFNHWKGACIIQGVVTRYRGGAKGDTALDLGVFDRIVVDRSTAALAALEAM